MAKYNYTQPANELQRFADMVEFPDAEPTENSAQLVTSGGVYDAIQAVEEEAKQLSYNSLMEDTASGSIASFPDGAENVPVKEMVIQIEPVQSGSGDPSPDNIRPISGYTGAEIPVNGNNLCNWKINTTNADPLEIYLKPNTYRIEASAAIASGNWYVRMSNASGEYFANADMGLDGWSRASSGWAYGGAAATGVTFTVPSGCALVEIGKLNAEGTIPAMLNIGSTALPYEPYNGTVYSIDWSDEAGTVYGDSLMVDASGAKKLTTGHGDATINGSEGYTWNIDNTNADYTIVYATPERTNIIIPNHVIPTESSDTSVRIICDKLKGAPRAGLNSAGCVAIQGGSYCVLILTLSKSYNITTSAEFNTWLASNNLQFVYELATPVEYDLADVQQIKTLLGDNNIWSDTGDISVKYRCNTALYIEKKLGA